MAASPFFARIKGDVLRIIAAIPPGRIRGFEALRLPVADLPHGVPRQTRPADAPDAGRRTRRAPRS